MSNNIEGDRLWTLDTSGATSTTAAGTEVIVRKVVFLPAGNAQSATIQEYDPAGAARTAIVIQGNAADVNMVSLDFGPNGRSLNGFNLSAISGGTLYCYLGKD